MGISTLAALSLLSLLSGLTGGTHGQRGPRSHQVEELAAAGTTMSEFHYPAATSFWNLSASSPCHNGTSTVTVSTELVTTTVVASNVSIAVQPTTTIPSLWSTVSPSNSSVPAPKTATEAVDTFSEVVSNFWTHTQSSRPATPTWSFASFNTSSATAGATGTGTAIPIAPSIQSSEHTSTGVTSTGSAVPVASSTVTSEVGTAGATSTDYAVPVPSPSDAASTVVIPTGASMVTQTKTVHGKSSSTVALPSVVDSSLVPSNAPDTTTIHQTSVQTVQVTLTSTHTHHTPATPYSQTAASTPSILATPTVTSLDSCTVFCAAAVCTDDVLLRGTPTRLTYLCSRTKGPHAESAAANTVMASTSSVAGNPHLTSTAEMSAIYQASIKAPVPVSSNSPTSSKFQSTIYVTVTEYTTTTPVSTTLVALTPEPTTVVQYLTSTLFETSTIITGHAHPSSVPSGVFWTGFPSGYYPTHTAALFRRSASGHNAPSVTANSSGAGYQTVTAPISTVTGYETGTAPSPTAYEAIHTSLSTASGYEAATTVTPTSTVTEYATVTMDADSSHSLAPGQLPSVGAGNVADPSIYATQKMGMSGASDLGRVGASGIGKVSVMALGTVVMAAMLLL